MSHLEPRFIKHKDGRVELLEVSICPGPDPNGLTTLPDTITVADACQAAEKLLHQNES